VQHTKTIAYCSVYEYESHPASARNPISALAASFRIWKARGERMRKEGLGPLPETPPGVECI
jgi:hypothetical protein